MRPKPKRTFSLAYGVVKLQGSAQSDEDKLAIEETICRVAGVVRVVNEMRVKPVVELIKRIPRSVPLTEAVRPPMLVHLTPAQYPVAKAKR